MKSRPPTWSPPRLLLVLLLLVLLLGAGLLLPAAGAETVAPLAAASPADPAESDGYPRQDEIDVVAYRFHLRLFDEHDRIEGVALVEIERSETSTLELDLIAAEPGAGTGMTVTAVERLSFASLDTLTETLAATVPAGEALRFEQREDRLHVMLPEPASGRSSLVVAVHYRGVPADGLVISRNRHGDRTFFGDNWPNRARHWLPVIDHPYEKARAAFVVEAPTHYQVVASGTLRETTDLPESRRRTWWQSEAPMATKVMVIGVARFAVEHFGSVDGVPVSSWVYPQDREAGFAAFAASGEILRFFQDRLGEFPYGKLAAVQSTTRYGGMENAGNIFYDEHVVDRGEIEGLIAHEIAHQWFGDSVTERDWHHVWLSEGFATYLSAAWLESRYGESRLRETMEASRGTVLLASARDPERSVVDLDLQGLDELLGPAVYQRGAWVLHMLRREVGEKAFWQGVAALSRDRGHGNALTSDFVRYVEQASGRSLDGFFTQWLERPELPELVVESRLVPGNESRLEIVLRQVQAQEPFDLWVDVEVEAARDPRDRRSRVRLSGRQARIVVRLGREGKPSPDPVVRLDPDVWLLYRDASSASAPAAR